jgi:hypothetical protein
MAARETERGCRGSFPLTRPGLPFQNSNFLFKNPQFDASVLQGFLESDFLGLMSNGIKIFGIAASWRNLRQDLGVAYAKRKPM